MLNKNSISELKPPLYLAEMGYSAIEEHLKSIPLLVVPIGGLETYGTCGPLGAAQIVSHFICSELSSRFSVLCAPSVNYSCTVAFRAFPGCTSLHHDTFINLIIDLCKGWKLQGFKKILFVNSNPDNCKHAEMALQRVNSSGKDVVGFFDWQTNRSVRAFISKFVLGNELGRSQKSILSMAAYFKPQLFEKLDSEEHCRLPDVNLFKRWQKMGKDPVKFRKLFPLGSTSEEPVPYDSSFGKELFEHILEILEREYTSFLKIN